MNNIIKKSAVATVAILLLGSCNIYKKYETPDQTALTKAYKEARELPADSAAFGNLRWESVFTDPMLADLINRALENNTSLENARLNVSIAHAQRLWHSPPTGRAPHTPEATSVGHTKYPHR